MHCFDNKNSRCYFGGKTDIRKEGIKIILTNSWTENEICKYKVMDP
jgi:hypothetical protein